MPSDPGVASVGSGRPSSSPSKAILGQVRFAPIPAIAETATVERLRGALEGDWPDFAGERVVRVPWGAAGAQEFVPTRSFRFYTADRAWSFVLTPGSLTLEATAEISQRSYREFAERFAQAWRVLTEAIPAPRLIHQGLRYTNLIERGLGAAEWKRVIKPELLGPLADPAFAAGVIESLSEFRLSRPPDATLILRHGIARAARDATSYVLDFDQFAQHRPQPIAPEAVSTRFDGFDQSLREMFRWCVIDKGIVEPASS